MNPIDFSQVPKNSKGQVKYTAIPSVVVRVMVAEEELTNLQDKLKRHHDSRESLRLPDNSIANAHQREARLIRLLEQWQGALAQ